MNDAVNKRAARRGVPMGAAVMAALLLTAVSGCSSVPLAAPIPTLPQQKIQSARHWQVIADDIAVTVSRYLTSRAGPVAPGTPVPHDPVALLPNRVGNSLFTEAFQQLLITGFVGQGHAVASEPRPDAVLVRYDVVLVPHLTPRDSASVPGKYTALGSGVYVLARMAESGLAWGLGLAGGVMLDSLRAIPGETQTELLLSVSIEKDGFFTFRDSTVYYVNDPDAWHYYALTPATATAGQPLARRTGQLFGTDPVECAMPDGSVVVVDWRRCRGWGGRALRVPDR